MDSIPLQLRKQVIRKQFKEFKRQAAAAKVKKVERKFYAANQSRLYADWFASTSTTNQEIQYSQPTMLNRCRQLARDDQNMKKFLGMVDRNIVFKGFRFQSLVADPNGMPDEDARWAIEKAWKEWSKKGVCTVCKRLSLTQAHRKSVRSKARDGEYFIRKHRMWKGNDFGFAIQTIPVEALDFQYTQTMQNGNIVIMGVELDKWNAVVGYHFWEEVPEAHPKHNKKTNKRIFIPADEIIHSYLDEFENQTRGVTWMHAAIAILKQYGSFLEAAVVAMRIAACSSQYYETPPDWSDEDLKKLNPAASMEPGSAEIGLPGVQKHLLATNHPTGNLLEAQKGFKRDIANGLGVHYNTFGNDLQGVNLSTMRYGVQDERDGWAMLQQDEIEDFLDNIFPEWLHYALLHGAIVGKNGKRLPIMKEEKFQAHRFLPRGYKYMDPVKDSKAAEIDVANGWRTNAEVTAERGGDWDENMEIAMREDEKIQERNQAPGEPANAPE